MQNIVEHNGKKYTWALSVDSAQVRVLGRPAITLEKDLLFAFPKRFERVVVAILANPSQTIFKEIKEEE